MSVRGVARRWPSTGPTGLAISRRISPYSVGEWGKLHRGSTPATGMNGQGQPRMSSHRNFLSARFFPDLGLLSHVVVTQGGKLRFSVNRLFPRFCLWEAKDARQSCEILLSAANAPMGPNFRMGQNFRTSCGCDFWPRAREIHGARGCL